MAEKYYEKIKKSKLYNYLNRINIGERTFGSEQEKINIENNVKNFLKERCQVLCNPSYETIKYSLYVLYNLGYEYLINDYLNIGESSFVKIYNYVLPDKLSDIDTSISIKITTKMIGNLSKTELVGVNVAYDYIFCKLYKNQKEKKFVSLKDKNIFDGFDDFKKNYIQK
jgi:hypothetical protein